MRRFHSLIAFLAMAAGAGRAQAPATPAQTGSQDLSALEQKIRDLEDRVVMLEGQIRQLKAQAAPAPAPAPGAAQQAPPAEPAPQPQVATQQVPPVEPRLGGAGPAAAKALNPDISAIGDFIASAGHDPVVPTPSFEMHEAELGFQAIIDPYARGDVFLSFGETGVNLEEGYITFTALPQAFVTRAGKMRAAFGKVNTMHNHVLPWVNRPLVTQNLVGQEDGINDAGVSVNRYLPAPKNWFLDFTGQVFRGDSADVFLASVKNDVSVVGHLRAYKDLTENSNLDLGGSYSRGHNLFGTDFVTNLYGVDAAFRWKPLQRAIYRSFVARSEAIWRQQDQPSLTSCTVVVCPPNAAPGFQRAFGFYVSGDYQFARRWFAGIRLDDSDRPFNASLTDKGASAVLTYWPSEFSQIRGQYQFTRYAGNIDSHELFVQVQFSLGAHGAHPF